MADIERGGRELRDADDAPPRLGDVCAAVADLMNESAWAEALTVDARELALVDFMLFAELGSAYDNPATATALPLDGLDAVLEEVAMNVPPPELSLWDRAMNWLQERLGQRGDGRLGWLEGWLEDLSVSERWLRYIVIALGGLLVLATGFIVWNELRAAGVFARGHVQQRFSRGTVGASNAAPSVRTLDDVRRAPAARQPALLLALVLARLRKTAPIPDSLTHRELAASGAALVPAPQRAAFGTVVSAAERATFGGWQPQPPELAPILDSGAAVLEDLTARENAGPPR